jgi:tetraacyldisaccharide 4'-kinase
MLAQALPGVVVAVGPRRDAVGREVEARFGRRVHVLDDGFQHLRLARDLDLLCLDVADLEDRPLPAGRLRERTSAVDRADLVLLTRVESVSRTRLDSLERRLGPDRTLGVRRRVLGYRTPDSLEASPPRKAFLLAAIARPERLEADVAAGGVEVAGRAFFRDHHRWSDAELARVAAEARAAGADAIVTTAKDAVRLGGNAPARLVLPLRVLAIAAEFFDEARMRARLREAVGRAA